MITTSCDHNDIVVLFCIRVNVKIRILGIGMAYFDIWDLGLFLTGNWASFVVQTWYNTLSCSAKVVMKTRFTTYNNTLYLWDRHSNLMSKGCFSLTWKCSFLCFDCAQWTLVCFLLSGSSASRAVQMSVKCARPCVWPELGSPTLTLTQSQARQGPIQLSEMWYSHLSDRLSSIIGSQIYTELHWMTHREKKKKNFYMFFHADVPFFRNANQI